MFLNERTPAQRGGGGEGGRFGWKSGGAKEILSLQLVEGSCAVVYWLSKRCRQVSTVVSAFFFSEALQRMAEGDHAVGVALVTPLYAVQRGTGQMAKRHSF